VVVVNSIILQHCHCMLVLLQGFAGSLEHCIRPQEFSAFHVWKALELGRYFNYIDISRYSLSW